MPRKRYNAENIAAAFKRKQRAENQQRLLQVGLAIFNEPSELDDIGFGKLNHDTQLATIVWVERNKGLFLKRGVSSDDIFKFSEGIVFDSQRHKSKAESLVRRYSLHSKTSFFSYLNDQGSTVEDVAYDHLKHDTDQEKFDFYYPHFEALSPEIAFLLFRTVITRSKDRIDLNRFRSGGKDFYRYRHILTMCTYKVSRNKKFKSQFKNLMSDNKEWHSVKAHYPINIINLLPEPMSPDYFQTAEKAQAKFGEQIKRLLKPKRTRTSKVSKKKQKEEIAEAKRKVVSKILPGFEKSDIKRTVTISSLEDAAVNVGLDQNEELNNDEEIKAEFQQGTPAEDYKTLVDNSINPSTLGSRIFSFANERSEANATLPEQPKKSLQPKTATIQLRDGAQSFRENILRLYGGKCCVSGCNVEAVLEAAHIQDHSKTRNNDHNNGLCLRRDIHTLFDRGLLKIDSNYLIKIDVSLANSEYMRFDGQTIDLPKQQIDYPKKSLLEWKWNEPMKGD